MITWRGCGSVPLIAINSRTVCLPLIAGMCLLSVPLQALVTPDPTQLDTVTFSNGDHLSGHLKMATGDGVTFSGVVTGDVALKWQDIKELDLRSSKLSIASSQNPQGISVVDPVIEVTGPDLCVRVKSQCLQTFPLSELISASVLEVNKPPSAPDPPGNGAHFKPPGGTLKISPESVVRATQKQIQLAGAFDLGVVTNSEEKFKHQATNIALEANYQDSRKPGGAAVITQLYSGTIQQAFHLTDTKSEDGPYLYGITNFYHNLSLGMNLAQSYGGGIGWDRDYSSKCGEGLKKTCSSSYTLGADIRYLGEDLYSPGKSLSLAVAGLTEQYSHTFPWRDISFSERILFLPAFNNSHAFQLRGTTGLDFPITDNFSIDVDLLDDYIRNAPPKSLQNFAKVTFSLKYTIAPPKSLKSHDLLR